MNSFNLLQLQMQWLGVLPRPMNQRTLQLFSIGVIYGIILEYFTTTFWYFAFEANTLSEYAESFYILSFGPVIFAWYSTYLWQSDDFHFLFHDLNAIVQKSKTNIIIPTSIMYFL